MKASMKSFVAAALAALAFAGCSSYSEIARRENVSESAVRGQIKASLLQLRRVLAAQEITLADFDCPSDHGLLPVLTRNGQKAKDRKRVLTRSSGDRHVA